MKRQSKSLVLTENHLSWRKNSSLWICPACRGVNAWNWGDAERAQARLKVEVKVCSGSCFDNICGHCHSNIVEPDSPILSACYAHSED